MSLPALTLILMAQLAGETFVTFTGLPIPGPVIGFLIMFIGLVLKKGVPEPLQQTSTSILRFLSIMFVPAIVGVMVHVGRIAEHWQAVVAAIFASTALTIIITGWLMQRLTRNLHHDNGGDA